MAQIARKGDTDNLGHAIQNGCDEGVTIDGVPIAVKGSTMDDGVAIVNGTLDNVTINGKPVAVVGSTTEKHIRDPGKRQVGTINVGAGSVSAS